MISPELVIKEALRNRLGNAQDNFARAKRQFQYYTQEQLDQEYGESSSTCRQLLKDYQTNVDNCDNAIKWFEKTLKDVRDSDNVISNLIGERDALRQANEDDTVLLGTVAGQRDAALAERDAAERNEREYRAACEMSICALRDSRERWEQRAVLAQAERDALRADLKLTQGVLAAAQHRLIAWGCRDGHDEDGCPLCSAEHALLNTREYLAEAHRVLRECHEVLANLGYITDDDDPESLCARVAAVLAQEEKK